MSDCIFCKIRDRVVPAPILYEDEFTFCIRDIHPQAKMHLLVIPKQHVSSLDSVFPKEGEAQSKVVGQLFEAAVKIARQQGLLPDGFRSVINTHQNGGQTVFHLHLHLLGGELLRGNFA